MTRVLLALALLSGCKDWSKCTDNGGHVEKRNCEVHTVFMPVVGFDGSTTLVPSQVVSCDEVCVGASAEAR